VAGIVAKNGVRMRGAIIEKLRASLGGGFDTVCLGGCDGVYRDEYGGIDGTCVQKKGANAFP
jgi:hypothetical protein